MFIISIRKNFNDADHIAAKHRVRNINLKTGKTIGKPSLTLAKLISKLKNKSVLMLIHGYNNRQSRVYGAYDIIENKISKLIPGKYDYVIGYAWPGGDFFLEWRQAKKAAANTKLFFGRLIKGLSKKTKSLDLMSHSLGAEVVLGALNTSRPNAVRHYYCIAAAVDHECLEPGKSFFHSAKACQRLFVFHSVRDDVLFLFYPLKERNPALGWNGPRDKNYVKTAKRIYVVDCQNRVGKHNDYKNTDRLYKFIGKSSAPNLKKFNEL